MTLSVRGKSALTLLFIFCIGLIAIFKITDPDAWMHLTLGRLIWNLRGLPAQEPFLSSMAGEPFSYSSWLFGVLYYGAYHFFGAYGVILLKSVSIMGTFAILLRDSETPFKNRLLAISVLIVVAVCIRDRFVERPDTFLMIFLSYSIMALNLYLFENKKCYLYFLPLIHFFWANSHSSIILMFVPFTAVLVGGVFNSVLMKRGMARGTSLTKSQSRLILYILIASFLCALISPYGIGQFSFASQLLNMDLIKQEINEMLPTSWIVGFRWFYVLLGVTILSFIAARKRFILSDLLRIIPLIYLGFLSRRFTYIFAVVAAPILIRNITLYVRTDCRFIKNTDWMIKRLGIALVCCWLAAWTLVALVQIGPFKNENVEFGFGFNPVYQPEGALAYMDRRNINGRLFNDSICWGQYIEWRDYPRRIPFIDGRNYCKQQLLEQIFSGVNWEDIADNYKIDAFIVSYPKLSTNQGNTEIDQGLSIPGWVLVYWDDSSLVYLRRGGNYNAVIDKDEYSIVKPANGVLWIDAVVRNPLKQAGLIAELQRNIRETGSARAYYLLGKTLMQTGSYQQAIDNLQHVKNNTTLYYNDIALCYAMMGNEALAIKNYQESIKIQDNSIAHCKIGYLYLKKLNATEAIKHLKQSIAMDKNNTEAYKLLIAAYKNQGNEVEASKILQEYKETSSVGRAEEFFKVGLKAYQEQNYAAAIDAFEQSIAVNPNNANPFANLGFVQYDTGQIDKAFYSFQQALKLDANSSLAHFGIAMIYKKRGDSIDANTHWKRYLELEPAGYFSRQVKQELENK